MNRPHHVARRARARAALPALLAAALLATGACDQALKIRNVAPRVTAVTEATPAQSGMRILFWVQDHESDPVDVAAAWAPATACAALRARVADSGEDPPDPTDPDAAAALGLRPLVELPGAGHHTVGLTSEGAFPGVPHEVLWDTSAVDASDVCLYLLPDDRNGRTGEPAVSPDFSLAAGFTTSPSTGGADAASGAAD